MIHGFIRNSSILRAFDKGQYELLRITSTFFRNNIFSVFPYIKIMKLRSLTSNVTINKIFFANHISTLLITRYVSLILNLYIKYMPF